MLKIIEKLENAEISFGQWVTAFTGVVIIRFLLETFSSPSVALPAAPDMSTMVHYFLFFIGAFISCALVINIFVPDIGRITKLLLFIVPIIWLPPVVDMIRSGGVGYIMAYIFAGPRELILSFFTLGGVNPFGGVTPGIKTEIVLLVAGVAWYVFLKSKSFSKTILVALVSYSLIFFWLAIPSLIAMMTPGLWSVLSVSPAQVLNMVIGLFSTSHIPLDILRPTEQVSYGYGIGLVINAGLSHVFYILDSVLIGLWFFIFRPDAGSAIFKNIRPGRAIHFLFMVAIGIGAAVIVGSRFESWVDGMTVVSTAVAFVCAWLFAVGSNDMVDISIDEISNRDRPLVMGTIGREVMYSSSIFFLVWSLIGAFISGYWTFFLMVVFTAAYYIYSIPPLRLKQVPILGTFLIAIASLAAAMSGFYLLSNGRLISDFPRQLGLIVVVFFTLCTNIKDIKDIKGDRANGITTIPALFGEVLGRRIVGLLFALSFILVGVIVGSPLILGISIIAAIMGYVAVAIGQFREGRTFVLYFTYAIIVVVLILNHRI